jgi:hypothetical protein
VTRIVVFAKAPLPGRVKTRLIPALGAEGAAKLAAEMLAKTLEEAAASGLGFELCGDPDAAQWGDLLPDARFVWQGEGDLGERLARAAERVLGEGENVLLVGADCPELDRTRLRQAADALWESDAIIHPAADGGYILLGLRRFHPSLFEGIAWSTAGVAQQTLDRLAALSWSVQVGDTLADVDEPSDLPVIPAKAGISGRKGAAPLTRRDSGFRRNDGGS